MIVRTTLEQRQAAKEAAWNNYWDKYNCPNRAGWTGGKCPVMEYYGKVGELGAANFMGYDWHDLCLYSSNPADYTKPDIGEWDIKAGTTFSPKDIAKGVKYILWVRPLTSGSTFGCNRKTCSIKVHPRLSGAVRILGWTDVNDVALCKNMGSYYRVTDAAMRSPESVPAWGAAA